MNFELRVDTMDDYIRFLVLLLIPLAYLMYDFWMNHNS